MTDNHTAVDWARPIQFANGEPLVLLGILADGRRLILRPYVPQIEASVWEMSEDGRVVHGSLGHRVGCWVVNRHD